MTASRGGATVPVPAPPEVRLVVPGSGATVTWTYDEDGRLRALRCGDRVHVVGGRDGLGRPTRTYGDGLAVVTQHVGADELVRAVRTGHGDWSEHYRWDAAGRLASVDGVEVQRDDDGRVTACTDAVSGAGWRYGYAGRDLVRIEAPDGVRHVPRDRDGRPVELRDGVVPVWWHRDALGRLWTVVRPDGSVEATYLWDGMRCLGRVDGPPTGPLSAVFSLDPGGTPVRIVSRDGVQRVPRDAYGEALLAHPGVPGLYGGAVHDGVVHLPLRRLDPRAGSFTSADPWDGGRRDPRRASGYRGPLLTESDVAGPHAVCRHDPVGRADPSGAVSGLLLLSDVTWSLQNNLLSWFGLDWTVNLWGSLFVEPGEFFTDWEALASSERLGAFGVRRGGVVAGDRAFTFQHIVYANAGKFTELARTWVVVPDRAFAPVLLGSLLRVAPAGGPALLLGGDRSVPGARAWSRGGGRAVPVVPGSRTPAFPEGGLHLGGPVDLPGGGPCRVEEVVPVGRPATATCDSRALVSVPATSLGLAVGGFVLLTGTADAVTVSDVVSVVETSTTTLLTLREDPGAAGTVGLRGLGAGPVSTETRRLETGGLDAVGTTVDYRPGDPLRLRRGATNEGALLVTGLEARLALAAPLPPEVGPGATLHVGTAGAGTAGTRGGAADDLVVDVGAPGRGQALEVTDGTVRVVGVVLDDSDPTRRVLDADLTAAGLPPGSAVTWALVAPASRLGRRAADPETAAVVTYVPEAAGTAPTGGYLIAVGATRNAVRAVTGRVHDVVLTSGPPPDPGADYDVDRFVLQEPDVRGAAVVVQQLVATTTPLDAPDAVSLRLQQWDQTTLAALLPTPATAAGVVVSGTRVTGLGAPSGRPVAGEVVALVPSGGGPPRPATVRASRLRVRLDRPVDALREPLSAVVLEATGTRYAARRVDGARVTVLPVDVPASGAAGRTRLPRFSVGEQVRVTAGRLARHCTVLEVDGTTLRLDGAPLPPPPASLAVQRLVPVDPGTGASRVAVAGTPAAAAEVVFETWRGDAVTTGTVLAVTDGTATVAVAVSSVADWELQLASAPGDGTYDLSLLPDPPRTRLSASFSVDGSVLLLDPQPASTPPALRAGEELVVVTAYGPGPGGVEGRLSSGTVRVPEAEESFEIDRRQSLVDHELVHTLQSARLGPLLLAFFPLFALEALFEGTSDVELPRYSRYVSGTVALHRDGVHLTPDPDPSVTFAEGDRVQVSRAGGPTVTARLRSGEAGAFRLEGDGLAGTGPGPVSVRRDTSTYANTAWDVLLDVLGTVTHGGALNLVAGSVWGSLFWALAKLGNALHHAVGGTGTMVSGTVEGDGTTVRLDAGARAALRGASWVVLQHGGATLVRPVRSDAGDEAHVVLGAAVSFRGEVSIGPHTTETPGAAWEQYDFFPAVVDDPGRPARLRVAPVGSRQLQLHVHDLVELQLERTWTRSSVVHADGDVVELSDPVLTGEQGQRHVRIARIGEADPLSWFDSAALQHLGMGWMRWAFDPVGQLQYRTHADPQSAWGVTARALRYALGTRSWSVLPFLGWFFWDNAFVQGNPGGHVSEMEQEASEQSGDLYSPVGRLRDAPSVAGDLGRYWFYAWDGRAVGNTRFNVLYEADRRDGPTGTNLRRDHLLMPDAAPPTTPPAAATLNEGWATPAPAAASPTVPVGPGGVLPDELVDKTPDLRGPTAGEGFSPSERASVPLTAETERSTGAYVAFSRPGTHRVTVREGLDVVASRQAQEAQKLLGGSVQRIFYDVPVQDVTVRLGGVTVAEGEVLTLVATQRARLVVEVPATAATAAQTREWVVDTTRNAAGEHLRVDGTRTALVAQAEEQTGLVAEVARRYADAGGGRYSSGGLAGGTVHLGGDVHVPVRTVDVAVVRTLPLRTSLDWDPDDPGATAVASVRPGERLFLVVPAAVVAAPSVDPVVYPGTTTPVAPVITVPAEVPGGVLAEHVGDGQVYELLFPADPVPASPVTVTLTVGTAEPEHGASAVLRAEVELVPA